MELAVIDYPERTETFCILLIADGYSEESAATSAHVDTTISLTLAHSNK